MQTFQLHKEFRQSLRECTTHATFELLRLREEQLNREGLHLYKYKITSEDLQVHIWSLTSLPEPIHRPPDEYRY